MRQRHLSNLIQNRIEIPLIVEFYNPVAALHDVQDVRASGDRRRM